MIEDDSNITQSDFIFELSWQIAMGADESIQELPVNRYRAVSQKQTAEFASLKNIQNEHITKAKSPTVAPMRTAVSRNAPLGTAEAVSSAKKLAAACDNLAELEQAILGFDGCALKQTASNTVFGDGKIDADVMFIGEAPGDEEDKQGKPLMGSAGHMLNQMLSFIGLNRDNAYFTNTLYWRPPGKRSPTEAELASCLPLLTRHIQLVDPKVIVLLGTLPTNMLLGNNDSIKRLRGKWAFYKSEDMTHETVTLPMFYPGFLLKNPEQKRLAWKDMLMLRSKLEELGIYPK